MIRAHGYEHEHRMQLQDQLEAKEMQKFEAYQEFLREKRMIDEIVQKINDVWMMA